MRLKTHHFIKSREDKALLVERTSIPPKTVSFDVAFSAFPTNLPVCACWTKKKVSAKRRASGLIVEYFSPKTFLVSSISNGETRTLVQKLERRDFANHSKQQYHGSTYQCDGYQALRCELRKAGSYHSP